MQHEHPHGGETLRQAVITQPGDTAANDLIDLEAAARFLGLKKSYLYKLTSTRQIPFYKYGGRLVLFLPAAPERMCVARRQSEPHTVNSRDGAGA